MTESNFVLILANSRRVQLNLGSCTLGRLPGVEIFVEDPSVSSRHCEFQVEVDSVQVRDLGSSNGTWADGVRVAGSFVAIQRFLQVGGLSGELQSTQVEISIPLLTVPVEPTASYFEDGWPACFLNPALRATHQCSKCGLPFHHTGLRRVGLVGSRNRLFFCPHCDGQCFVFAPTEKRPWWERWVPDVLHGWVRKNLKPPE